MRWTGDPQRDTTISLVDDTESLILGQVIRDQNFGWTGEDYLFAGGAGKHLGHFDTPELAQEAVAVSVSEHKKGEGQC